MVKVHDLHQQIADLEAEIDNLSDACEQCRKSMVAAKMAIGAGMLLFGATLVGLFRLDPIVLVVGIAVILAGIGFYGSSRGSLEHLAEKIRRSEARRAEMIDRLDLQAAQDS